MDAGLGRLALPPPAPLRSARRGALAGAEPIRGPVQRRARRLRLPEARGEPLRRPRAGSARTIASARSGRLVPADGERGRSGPARRPRSSRAAASKSACRRFAGPDRASARPAGRGRSRRRPRSRGAVVVSEPDLRGRLGQDRVAARGGERGDDRGEREGRAGARPGSARAGCSPIRARRCSSRTEALGAAGRRSTAVNGRSPRPSRASEELALTARRPPGRRQRLAPGHVQVDWPWPRLSAGGGVRTAGDSAEMEQAVVVGVVRCRPRRTSAPTLP